MKTEHIFIVNNGFMGQTTYGTAKYIKWEHIAHKHANKLVDEMIEQGWTFTKESTDTVTYWTGTHSFTKTPMIVMVTKQPVDASQ